MKVMPLAKQEKEPESTRAILSFLWLEVTGQCNLRCKHCYASSSPDGTVGVMNAADWEQVLTDAKTLGCQAVQFIGGEPTIYPHLAHLLQFASRLGLAIEVYSNLVSIRPVLWKVFQECQVSIATSFYSVDAAIHEEITQGRGNYLKTVRNIQHVIELGLSLRVGLVEMCPDQRLQETEQFLRHLGVQQIGSDRVRSVGRGQALTQEVDVPEAALCGACARGKAAVLPSGEVYPCVFSRWLSLGNVRETSFAAIMQSDRVVQTRERLQQSFARRQSAPSFCSPYDCGPFDCDPSCDPNCEPSECSPDIPSSCSPTHLCIPDYKEPCSPEKPCSPMDCNPDREGCK